MAGKKCMKGKRNNTRRIILDSAFECFSQYGYSKTAFLDVARIAGISRQLIYKYFKNKEDLFIKMTEETHDFFIKQSEGVLKSDTSKKEKILEIVNIWIIQSHRVILKSPNPNAWFDMLKSMPKCESRFKRLFIDSMTPLLGDDLAEVFVFSIKGFLSDKPRVRTLEKRIEILINLINI